MTKIASVPSADGGRLTVSLNKDGGTTFHNGKTGRWDSNARVLGGVANRTAALDVTAPLFDQREHETVGDAIARTVLEFNGSVHDRHPAFVNTFFTEATDGLTVDETDAILRGDVDEADQSIRERLAPVQRELAEEHAERIVEQLGADWKSMDDIDRDEVIEAVIKKDRHDPIMILAGVNDTKRTFRLPLGRTLHEELDSRGMFDTFDGRLAVVMNLLDEYGVDVSNQEVHDSVYSLVGEGPEDWSTLTLDVVWHGEIMDARVPTGGTGPDLKAGREIKLSGTTVVIHDPHDKVYAEAWVPEITVRATDRQPAEVVDKHDANSFLATRGGGGVGYLPNSISSSSPGDLRHN